MNDFKRHTNGFVPFSNRRLGLTALALLPLLTPTASASDGMQPGSLLIFPEFDSTPGRLTLFSVVNTSPTESITVKTVYYEEGTCLEFNRLHDLTPLDTYTFIAKFHNPAHVRGFLAIHATTALAPVAFNHLIGTSSVFDGIDSVQYAIEPFVFEGIAGDLNGDGVLDLDGVEYSMVPDTFVFPRFLGQNAVRQSDLVLIALTGDGDWSTVVNFLAYNDNEEVFSTQYQFSCWTKVELGGVSGVFTQAFLQDFTNQNPLEPIGWPAVETGWMQVRGDVATSPLATVDDPAILAFLIERSAPYESSADLPFGVGQNANGSLLDRGLTSQLGGPVFNRSSPGGK